MLRKKIVKNGKILILIFSLTFLLGMEISTAGCPSASNTPLLGLVYEMYGCAGPIGSAPSIYEKDQISCGVKKGTRSFYWYRQLDGDFTCEYCSSGAYYNPVRSYTLSQKTGDWPSHVTASEGTQCYVGWVKQDGTKGYRIGRFDPDDKVCNVRCTYYGAVTKINKCWDYDETLSTPECDKACGAYSLTDESPANKVRILSIKSYPSKVVKGKTYKISLDVKGALNYDEYFKVFYYLPPPADYYYSASTCQRKSILNSYSCRRYSITISFTAPDSTGTYDFYVAGRAGSCPTGGRFISADHFKKIGTIEVVECLTHDDCPAKDNIKGKCDPETYTCKWPPCSTNADCVEGYCCVTRLQDPANEGKCVGKGIYSNNPKYLCDPPVWKVSQNKEEKNVFELIYEFILQAFFQR